MKNLIYCFAILTSVFFYASCKADQHEATPDTTVVSSNDVSENPDLGDNPSVTSRDACGTLNECEVDVTTNINANLTVCGDIASTTTFVCSYCGGTNNGVGWTKNFASGVAEEFCLNRSGAFCIFNNSGTSVTVTVQVGTSTPVVETISPNTQQCFHTNANCETFSRCP
jgi:hypothetical protein